MDELKKLYFSIENPIDNKIKWNKLLNMYSSSIDFEDFYSKITKESSNKSVCYEEEDKNNFYLMMWSIWKQKLLSLDDESIKLLIENKIFDSSVYDVIAIINDLESVRDINSLRKVLAYSNVSRFFSKLFSESNHDLFITSDFKLRKDMTYNTVFTITVSATNIYNLLKAFINQCMNNELPYYIKCNDLGTNIVVSIYSITENIKKNETILSVLKKENYTYFSENKGYNILSGNINEWVSIKHMNFSNIDEYINTRSLILFKSFDSVMYEYIESHLNILVSYKDGRNNLIEYLASNVMEKVVAKLISNNIRTDSEFFFIANSEDLINLKEYIRSRLSISMKDILKKNLYLKDGNDKVELQLNQSRKIDIDVNVFMYAIRNLTLTLMLKDSTLEKLFRARIKNECHYYKVDPDKFCFDIMLHDKIFFDEEKYNKYRAEVNAINDELVKFDNLEMLINSKITEETRKQISTTINELISVYDD